MSINNDQIRLQDRMAEYAHDLLATHTVQEYAYVLGKWEDYIDSVVDAEAKALRDHENVLNMVMSDLQKQQQEEQNGAMFAMLALTLVCGPALSWIAGSIQYKLYPALASKPMLKRATVHVQNRYGKTAVYRMTTKESDHDKVMGKVFGDAAANSGQQIGVDKILGSLVDSGNVAPRGKGKSAEELAAIAEIKANTSSDELHRSLRSKLLSALRDEKEKTSKTISDLGLEARRNPQFKIKMAEQLLTEYSQVRGAHSGPIMDQLADRVVEQWVDKQRAGWAKEWLYYGNLPPQTPVDEMARKIEREIWAMWIIDQQFKFTQGAAAGRHAAWTKRPNTVAGREGFVFHKRIVNRLFDLGVVLPRTAIEAMTSHNQRGNGYAQPSVKINGELDEARELAEVENWARNLPSELLSGVNDRQPRHIGSILNVHKKR